MDTIVQNIFELKYSIIIIGPAWPLRGGIAAYNERMAQQFALEGNDVAIETFSLQYPSFLFPGESQYASWDKPHSIESNTSINSINPINWIKIGNKIAKQKPDFVIFRYWLPFMGPCLGTIARRIKRNKHTKLMCLVDNIIPHEKRFGDKQLTQYFTKPFDGFISMSKSVDKDLEKFTSKPKSICPHPLFDNYGPIISREEALQRLNLDPNCKYLLFFGLIRGYKGLDILLDALAELDINNTQYKLIIAGEYYADPKPYNEQIEKHNLKDSIISHTYFIPDHLVSAYFCASDLVVQPYKSATQSGVTQVGYHFEKPMLVTDVGGLSEIIPDQKVGYVTKVNSTSVANAIKDFIEKDRYQEFHLNIKEEKKRYSWEHLTETIKELYLKI